VEVIEVGGQGTISRRFRLAGIGFALAISVCGLVPIHAWPSLQQEEIKQASSDQASQPESELQKGIELTRNGHFAEAIPLFLAVRRQVSDEYAAEFNLALCYVGTGEFQKAIPILSGLRNAGHENADVENLLSQAYAGNDEAKEAFEAFQRAVAFTPKDEKLYLLVAAAFSKKQDYRRVYRVLQSGLQNLPDSARLHYELGYVLWQLEESGLAKPEFERAASLTPHSEISYLAAAQESFMLGDISQATQIARTGIRNGISDYQLLALLGEALIQAGASPGKPEFFEAKEALEKSIAARPNYASSQIALGRLLLQEGRVNLAIEHLELGRQLTPQDPAPCLLLATAYRNRGQIEQARAMLAIVAKLNEEQVKKRRKAFDEDR
jgi:tetratricopeptide (TPR) repeat protein